MTSVADLAIVTPVHNSGGYFVDLLETVLAQRVRPRRLIAVDDASTDASPAILEYLRQRHPDLITVIRLDRNGGPGIARNRGIHAADTDLVMFVDSDDVLLDRDVIGDIAAQAAQSDFDLLRLQFANVEEDPRSGTTIHCPERNTTTMRRPLTGVTAQSHPEIAYFNSFWQFVFRRDFLTGAGRLFYEDASFREDYPFMYPNLARARRIDALPRPGIGYRHRPGSIMTLESPETLDLLVRGHGLIRDELTALGQSGTALRHIVDLRYLNSVYAMAGAVQRMAPGADMTGALERFRDRYLADGGGELDLGRRIRLSGLPDSAAVYTRKKTNLARMDRRLRALQHSPAAMAERVRADAQPPAAPPRRTRTPQAKDGRRLFVHIGMTKTGSTALQYFLDRHRSELGDLLLFPKAGLTLRRDTATGNGHLELFSELTRRGGRSPKLAKLRQEIAASGAPNVLLSCENLTWSDRFRALDVPGLLAAHFPGHDIRILVVRRDPVLHFLSQYNQDVKEPWKGYAEDPVSYFRNRWASGSLDTDRTIAAYRRQFGDDKVVELGFERAGDRLLPEFLSLIDPNLAERAAALPPPERLNPALSDDLVPFARIVNQARAARAEIDRYVHAVQAGDVVLADTDQRMEVLRILLSQLSGGAMPDAALDSRLRALFGSEDLRLARQALALAQNRERGAYSRAAIVTTAAEAGAFPSLASLRDLLAGRRRPTRSDLLPAVAAMLLLHYLALLIG